MRKDRIVLKDRLERGERVVPLSNPRERIKIGLGSVGNPYIPPPPPPPPPPHGRVHVQGLLELNDDERILGGDVFGIPIPGIDYADEHIKLDNLSAWADVDTNFIKRFYWEGRCGGEVRFEVDMICGINEADPDLLEFQANARLYEGASEDTDDLDGSGIQYVQIPRGEMRPIYGFVKNTDENTNDWGVFSFHITFS